MFSLRKKAMMMGVTAGPMIGGFIVGLIIGAVALWFIYSRGILTCPGVG